MKRRLKAVVFVVAALMFGLAATSASAAGPVHDVLTSSGSFSAPAGTICDFNYESPEFETTINQLRFFDENGVLVRRLRTIEERIVHRNADTGFELVETVHYGTDLDVVAGVVRVSGNSWHLRTADGKLVLVLSGFELLVRATGEVIRATPMVGQGFENVICPALGGAPA